MSWQPNPRPDWVLAANRGEVFPIAETARLPLDPDGLMEEARASQGLAGGGTDDFGPTDFLEPFSIGMRALEAEADLHLVGRWMTRMHMVRLLEVRLQLERYLREDPGVLDEQIAEPVFVVGAPRTGTTILHGLLAQDDAHRVPLGWELLRPVPPPTPDSWANDPRIALADRELVLPQVVDSGLVAIHEYGGRMYKECISVMSLAFRTEELISRYSTPSYIRYLFSCDMVPAYRMHKLVLQVLQRRMPTGRWVLKSPIHLHNLPALLAVYPDAKLVVTHRDPLTLLGSVTSLVATLRWAFSDRVDLHELGRYHADLYHGDLDGLVTSCTNGTLTPDQVVHTRYEDFLGDPLAPVRAVYGHLGLTLSADTADAMRAYHALRPADRHGAHTYDFADLGLDAPPRRRASSGTVPTSTCRSAGRGCPDGRR